MRQSPQIVVLVHKSGRPTHEWMVGFWWLSGALLLVASVIASGFLVGQYLPLLR